ncbi:MAG: hemerythrin domain-containing protein [Neisseria sp.]|uniref:hemerythrin domain-containing protein n=1 Tax=Neisseria sp. TaxID=192066 RepID=UPI0026DC7591|nr:hemerythrin domain-containing protein [Neisseria sp.]MDO4640149.1 hemerythrin domain-containing protein [Neisseria sp.]
MNPFDTRSVTFAEPIEMLYACHGKVRRFCSQVDMLPAYIAEHGRNEIVQQAVKQIIQYFDIAAPLHHQDEEDDFFPLLLQYAPQALANIEELKRQHETLHANWTALKIEFNQMSSDSKHPFNEETAKRFTEGYAVHLALEEPLFEMGKQFIPQEKLAAIGRNMAQRRQN